MIDKITKISQAVAEEYSSRPVINFEPHTTHKTTVTAPILTKAKMKHQHITLVHIYATF